jgi:hypothetical protein
METKKQQIDYQAIVDETNDKIAQLVQDEQQRLMELVPTVDAQEVYLTHLKCLMKCFTDFVTKQGPQTKQETSQPDETEKQEAPEVINVDDE